MPALITLMRLPELNAAFDPPWSQRGKSLESLVTIENEEDIFQI
jgi:hypothetical protein